MPINRQQNEKRGKFFCFGQKKNRERWGSAPRLRSATPCFVGGVSIAPQGNFCQERQKSPKTPFETKVSKSYVLRTRMHSTSQKSIACGSYFWGVMDSFARLNLSKNTAFHIANRNADTSGQRQELPQRLTISVAPTDSRALTRPPIGALPRKRLASSATGSASALSTQPLTLLRR